MNVFIYGMKSSKFDALESLTEDNVAVTVGRNYTIEYTKGILILAFPEKDVDTNFEFEYWLQVDEEISVKTAIVLGVAVVIMLFILMKVLSNCCSRRILIK
jgi:hypothetical protein